MIINDDSAPTRPAHDPLSEEMDLITWQEAAARLYDETLDAATQIEALKSLEELTAAQRDELAFSQKRFDAMRRVAARLRSQRPADSGQRGPGAGWT